MSTRAVLLGLCLLGAVLAENVDLEKRKYQKEELDEGGTDPTVIENSEVALNARAMSHLLKNQDVVATCRYMLFKIWKNFWDAREACHNVEWPFTHSGIGMAKIQTEDQNTDVRTLLQLGYGYKQIGGGYNRNNWVWVGLTKRIDTERKMTNKEKGNFNTSEWAWQDNSEPQFSKWKNKMPDQQYSNKYKTYQNWVMINKRGYWDDTHAAIEAPYACNYCGKYIVIATPQSWDQAKKDCESYGLTMAIVDSAEDNEELAWAANLTFGPETNQYRWNYTNWIWLGTQEIMGDDGVGTGVFHHHDNSTLNWDPVWDRKRQPDNWTVPRGEQTVVAFSRINQKWDDSFHWKHRPFACMCDHRACEYT